MSIANKMRLKRAEVNAKLEALTSAYDHLVKSADEFAEAIHFKPEWVMKKALPLRSASRRTYAKEMKFELKEHIETGIKLWDEFYQQEEQLEEKKKLIESLGLTEEQVKLLSK